MQSFLANCHDDFLRESADWPGLAFQEYVRIQLTKEMVIGASIAGFFDRGVWEGASSLVHNPLLPAKDRLHRTTVDADTTIEKAAEADLIGYANRIAEVLNKVFRPSGELRVVSPEKMSLARAGEPGAPPIFRAEFMYVELRAGLPDVVRAALPHTKGQNDHRFRVMWEVTVLPEVGREPRYISGAAGSNVQVWASPLDVCLANKFHAVLNAHRAANPRQKWRSDMFDIYWLRGLGHDITEERAVQVFKANGFDIQDVEAAADKHRSKANRPDKSEVAAMAGFLREKVRMTLPLDALELEAEKILSSVRQWVVSRWDSFGGTNRKAVHGTGRKRK